MIRPLRQRHRVMMSALAVLLPAAFACGLGGRRAVPIAISVPPELETRASGFSAVVWTKADLWPGRRILTSLRRNSAGLLALELTLADVVKPDVLVYWVAGQGEGADALPENALLLGSPAGGALLGIPAEARDEAGRVLLYSLADHEVLARSVAVTIPKI